MFFLVWLIRVFAKSGRRGWVDLALRPAVGHDGLLAGADSLVMGLLTGGVLVVNLLLSGDLILFCQNELISYSNMMWSEG